MARGVNKVILVGNCGKDPERRQLPSGSLIVNVSLATTESWNDKRSGEKQTKTEWHRLVFFSPLAEIADRYIKRGSQIYIEGSIRYSESERDGVKRYYTDIVVRDMQLLGARGEMGDDSSKMSYQEPAKAMPSTPSGGSASGGAGKGESSSDTFDDDLPF